MVVARLDLIIVLLKELLKNQGKMMIDLSKLTEAVTKDTSVKSSIMVLLQGVANQMQQIKSDQDAIDALATQIMSNANSLADAAVANTLPTVVAGQILPPPPVVKPAI